jgi:hypothetical protein
MPHIHRICHACGGVIGRSNERVLKAAFGLDIPEDEESTENDFSDATHFEPKRYFYADGGEADLGTKRDVDLPGEGSDYQLPVYRGETAKRSKENERGGRRGLEEDEEGERDRYAKADGYASGGTAKLGSGKRFSHLTHQLEGRGDVKDPKALAATIGRAKFGAKKFASLGRHADGGEVERTSFADAMARRFRIHRSMHSR